MQYNNESKRKQNENHADRITKANQHKQHLYICFKEVNRIIFIAFFVFVCAPPPPPPTPPHLQRPRNYKTFCNVFSFYIERNTTTKRPTNHMIIKQRETSIVSLSLYKLAESLGVLLM